MVFAQIATIVLAFILLFVPGILVTFAVLRGISLERWEKFLLGCITGLVFVPLLLFLEFLIAGIKIDITLVLLNSAAAYLMALAALYQQNMLAGLLAKARRIGGLGKRFAVPKDKHEALAWLRANGVMLLIVASILLGFYVRFATSWSTSFFEFDPFYYDKLTEKLVQHGAIDTFTQDVYFPREAFQRWAPVVHYMTGSWYLLFQTLGTGVYSKEALILVIQVYPALVGALLSFLGYLIVKEEYGKYVGLITAFLFALTPQLITKFAAGVSEQQPFGLFAALLMLSLYSLAIRRKSLRISLLAGLATAVSILGSQQYVWPFGVVAAYLLVQGSLHYLKREMDMRLLQVNAITVASAIIGNLAYWSFQQGGNISLPASVVLLMVAGLVYQAVLYLLQRFAPSGKLEVRAGTLAAIVIIAILIVSFTPLLNIALGFVSGAVGSAHARGALGKTIAEEGGVDPSLYSYFFGILNPPVMLLSSAMLATAVAALYLVRRRKYDYAAALVVVAVFLMFFNSPIDSIVQSVAQGSSNPYLPDIAKALVSTEVFFYLAVVFIATCVSYMAAGEERSPSLMLFILVFLPIAYIGMNKSKFLIHLAFGLVLAAPYLIGESAKLLSSLNAILKVTSAKTMQRLVLAAILFVGLVAVLVQAQGVDRSMNELKSTRMPGDWVEVYQWMRTSAPQDARVMSWWDYGHWTTFLGERASVLDPSNLFPDFDQSVAFSFVDGGADNLYKLMRYHNATHVLVDADLIQKWGALVYLSGACDSSISPICPDKMRIENPEKGPGQSQYETSRYFEYMASYGESCPNNVSPVPMVGLYSSFGFPYCAGDEEMYPILKNTLSSEYSRSYKIITDISKLDVLDKNVSYLLPTYGGLCDQMFRRAGSKGCFINLNPYMSFAKIESGLMDSAFVRLFIFEKLPGFKLVHKTPNGQVKVFEFTGEPAASVKG